MTKNYYVVNRNYEYIGYDNIKCLDNIIENNTDENQNGMEWNG
jgi:hypothetical protein